jgi:hypothetical protein
MGGLWTRFNGSHTLKVGMVGGGAGAHFALGSSYQVDVSMTACSLTFHGDGKDFTCVWGSPADDSKAVEDDASKSWLILVGSVKPWESSTPSCQVNGWIKPDSLTGGFLYLPGEQSPTTFGL